MIIGTGDASETTFQLVKLYELGANVVSRTIRKPVSGTVVAGIDGVSKTLGVDFTVNTASGLITWTTAPGSGLDVTAGFEFDVPCRFDEGLDNNGLDVEIDAYEAGSVRQIRLTEYYIDGVVTGDPVSMGGSDALSFGIDVTLDPSHGRFITLDPTTTGLSVALIDPSNLQTGGPHKLFYNISANSVDIVDVDDVTVFTLAATSGCTLVLGNPSGTKTWYGF